ncbi:MAG: Cyclic dehypoxanthine futalosine synthase [bacterium]|nr:Cyclic dehypoxanthine futalosine synthase [bacterium]
MAVAVAPLDQLAQAPDFGDIAPVRDILDRIHAGERISDDEALRLYYEAPLHELGQAAMAVRFRHVPEPIVTYIVDRNINYTNVCVTYCKFCAFYRPPGHEEGYVLSREELGRKIDEAKALGATTILFQGGHHPDLRLAWYEETLRYIKAEHPIYLHAFSPSEIEHLAHLEDLPIRTVLERLIAAGLDSIPGGGAEILVDQVRDRIAPLKTRTDVWLEVMETAHQLGLKSTATMMYGHFESIADRIEHLRRLREVQDRTGGFTAFINWSFQPKYTAMQRVDPAWTYEYLRLTAVARCYLDNFPHLQSSWVTQGDKVGQLVLLFGADDMGGTMIEENVVSSAGTTYCMNEERCRALIRQAGFHPIKRNTPYEHLEPLPAGLD